jgi:transcription antitermination factor NusA-like protein
LLAPTRKKIEWSDDPILFVTNALSPAKVQRVSIVDDKDRVMEVVVEDKQLSLAIGKKGQNVRLAAKLTGWKIDIKSEEEKRKEVEAQLAGFDWNAVAEGQAEVPLTGAAAMDALFDPNMGVETATEQVEAETATPGADEPVGDASPHGLDEGPDADGVGEAKQD